MPVAPRDFTEAQKAEVETLAAVLTAAQMADYFGMARTSFYNLMDRDPEVAERYKRGRARAVGSVAQSLITKARAGNVVAMIFYLKTQGGWRESAEIAHVLPGDASGTGGVAGVDSGSEKLRLLLDRITVRIGGEPLEPEADRVPQKIETDP